MLTCAHARTRSLQTLETTGDDKSSQQPTDAGERRFRPWLPSLAASGRERLAVNQQNPVFLSVHAARRPGGSVVTSDTERPVERAGGRGLQWCSSAWRGLPSAPLSVLSLRRAGSPKLRAAGLGEGLPSLPGLAAPPPSVCACTCVCTRLRPCVRGIVHAQPGTAWMVSGSEIFIRGLWVLFTLSELTDIFAIER